jgi:hypothetical protein
MNLREILQRSLRYVPTDGSEERDLREAIEDALKFPDPKIYRAFYRTRHFDFEVFATDKDAAIANLIVGLRAHAKQYKLEPDWWSEGFGYNTPTDEIFEIHEFELGRAYRDRQVIP